MRKIPRHIFSWAASLLLPFCGYTQNSSYCSNTAMVPVFKQDFGQGTSSSDVSMAPGGSTNYIHGNVGTDGRYIVTPRVENAGKGDWTRGGDHTGNSNGNMFLVNAGSNKSILLQQTVNNLCSGSSYSFSAWAANVNTSETADICGTGLRYPRLTFNIKSLSNVLLASYTTGNLPLSPDNGPVNWQKYGFQFDLPANTSSLRIEIVDAWGGGDACGNDLALDDILFEACIPQITVSLNSSNSNICAGSGATIQSSLINSPYTSPAYQWQKSTDGITWAKMGSAVTGTGADQLKFPSTALTDGGLYRVTVAPTISSLDIATCSAHSNELSFTVNPLPQVAPASNGPLCSGKDLSLKANASGGSGSYIQYLWTGPASFQSIHADTLLPAVQTAAKGNYTVSVTDSKGCTATGNLSVQIDSTPVISVSSITDTICSGTTGQISVSSSVPNSSFYWDATVVSGSVTGNTTTSSPDLSGIQQSTLYNNNTINSAIRYSVYTVTTANCSSDTLHPLITVRPLPNTAVAGIDTTICNSAGFQLYGNTPTIGTGAWTQISGPNTAVFTDSTLAHTAVNNLIPGTYRFVWHISNSCASNADTMMLYYKAPPAPAFVLSDTSICGPASISFTNNTPNKTDYGFSWNFGNGTSSSLADPSSVLFAPSVSGLDTTYTITLKAFTGCDTATITKTLLVKQKPRTGLTVIPQNTCMPTTVQLINQSVGSNTIYKLLFGDGSDTTVQGNDTILHVYNAASSTTFQPMVIATNSCGADTATASFLATADLLNIQTNLTDTAVCGNPFTANFTNNTTGATQFTWTWGDGTADYTNSSAGSVQHVYQDSGSYTISLRILHACGDTTITKTIHITAMPDTAVAGIDTTICNSAGFQLYGNTPTIGTGAWTQISGPNTAVFTDSTLAHTAVNNLIPGTYRFVWRISNSCASYADTMMLYYKAPPAPAFVLSDTSICGPASVSFTNNTPNKADYGFSWNFGNGTSSSLADPAAVVFTPSVNGLDTTYTITLNAFTGCDTTSITKTLLVKQKPRTGLTVIPQNTCMPTTVQLINQSLGSNTTYRMVFGDGSDSTVLATDTVLHVYNAASSTTFQPMVIATNSCGADTATASFLATADLLNIQTNLTDTAVCGNPFTANFTNNTTGATQFTWTWGDGTADYTSATAGSVQHVYQDSGSYTISLRILHACGDTTITKTIHITAMPDTAVAGIDTTICNSAGFQLYGNTPTIGTGAWTQISGPNTAVFADSTLAHTAVNNLIPGTYRFVWHISNSCASNADTMMLYYKAPPAPAFVLSDTSICGPASISFTNNTPNKADYGFSWNFGNGTSSSLADPAAVVFAPSVSGLDTTYTITLKAFTACDTVTISKSILVKQKPRTGLTVIPQNTCMPTTVQLINQSVGSNTIYKLLFGDGSDTTVQGNDTILHVYNAASSTTFQPMVIATNSCGADTATAVLKTIANQVNIRLNLADTAVCGAPFELSFRNNSTGIPQFNWNWGDGTTSSTSDTGIVHHKYLQPGIYKLSLPVSGVCGDTLVTRNIHVYPSVKATFDTISANNCIGDSIQFKSLSGNTQLQWNINNSLVSNLQEFNFSFKQPGIFPIQLIASQVNLLKTCSDTSSRNIQIIAVQPGKGSITPLYGNCLPFVVQLTNQTNKPTNAVQWHVSNGDTRSGDSTSFTFNQSGTYKIIMEARNAGGCLFTDSATIQIKSPNGTIQYKGGAYCAPNNPISFTPEVSNTDSIEWNFGDGTILTTSVRTIKHQYKQQGIFRPVFTLISNTGCRIPIPNTDSIVIEVVKAGFKVNTVYECGTTTFHFKDSSSSLNGIRNHYWRVNSVPAGNDRSAMASFKRTGAQLTELSVESNYGCTDNIRGAYNVGIYNFPEVNINSINEACLNNLMELKSNIHSADSVIYRLWNLGNGQSATDSAVKVLYYDEGIYSVKLTASTINTCYDSAIKQIAIHALPAINLANEKNVCSGDSIVLRVNGTANYVWKDQQNNLICNNCNSITVRPEQSTQYQVIGYNEYGCSNIASTNVRVIQPGKIQVSPESVVCEGSSVRIWASGGNSYQWLPAPGIGNLQTPAPVVSPLTTTTYKVIGKDQYNCIMDTAYTKVVVGKPTPVTVGQDTSFIAGTKIKLHAAVATNNIVQWKWSGGADLSCVFCPEPIARVVNDEDIACTVTNEFGCITSDTLRIRTFCPGAEVFIPNAFSPDGDGRNDWLYVQAKGIKLVKNFRVYSRWGELVYEKNNFLPNDPTAGWNGRIKGNLANPDIYVYVCEVICEKGTPQLYKGNVAILK